MKIFPLLSILILSLLGCRNSLSDLDVLVTNEGELKEAISNAQPGSEIIMSNGEWNDIQIKFIGFGTEHQPITLRAESPGQVLIQGQSDLKLGGEYLTVEGLHFKNGASPSRSVIHYAINIDTVANHCQVTNCVIEDFNKSQRNQSDLWIQFRGRHNELSHSYITGKSNRGPTVRVDLAGNESIYNYHKIIHNHFGPRPPKGGPSAETIQIGNSSTSMAPSHTLVANNLFDRCNGEVEVISSKANFNEFRNNVFYKSEGSLVTRHGNYCIIDGNYFIGDEESRYVGGVRLIGTGHWVTNNYFYNLRGEIFRGPLAVMNGIRRSAINRYIQVTDVVVAHNTWVNCKSPWQFGVGSNVDQKDVLPPSEIRSETPIRTLLANNVIYNENGDPTPILRYASIDGIDFKSNVIYNQDFDFYGVEGLIEKDFSISEVATDIWLPTSDFNDIVAHKGFEFERIERDLFAKSRTKNNSIGAANVSDIKAPEIMDLSQYGPTWYDPNELSNKQSVTHSVSNSDELIRLFEDANNGDVIELQSGIYKVNSSLKVNKKLTVQSVDSLNKATMSFKEGEGSPLFEMNPKGELILKSVNLVGNNKNYAFATLKENMSSHYNLKVVNAGISDFDYVVKAYKFSFAQHIEFKSTRIKNCNNGLELSSEDDDRGEYNSENLYIIDCQFDGVKRKVIDYYRGGYDESTVGGNLLVSGSTFINSGQSEESGVLINNYGIINVDIAGNTFRNNQVRFVSRLWGAKNNSHSENVIINSGRLITEQNLPLKLMY